MDKKHSEKTLEELITDVNAFVSKFEMTKDQEEVFNGIREEMLSKLPEGLKIRDRMVKGAHNGKGFAKVRELIDTIDTGLVIHPTASFTELAELGVFNNGVAKATNQANFMSIINDIKGKDRDAEQAFERSAKELLALFDEILDDIEKSTHMSLQASLEALDICKARGIQFKPQGTHAKLQAAMKGRKK